MCNIDKPIDSYHKCGKNADGTDRVRARCKVCINKLGREYNSREEVVLRTKARDAIRDERYLPTKEKVYDYLKNNPCVDCGEADILYLEFDHLRDKIMGIGKLMQRRYKWEEIKKEIDKCEVRCVKCHRLKTATQFGWTILDYRN